MFHKNQQVICINNHNNHYVKVGTVYTVKWCGYSDMIRENGVLLIETQSYYADTPFYIWRFRPLEERKTDISIFKEILNKVSEDA